MSRLDPSTGSGRRDVDRPAGRTDHPGQPDPRLGLTVTHRRYVPYSHAHYAGNLVDGAYSLGLFGDVATEVCIRTDGDEGLFASYSDVQFRGPVRAGDVLEVTAEVVRVGSRSRTLEFRAVVVGRGRPDVSASAAEMLDVPVVATTATGVVVVPTRPGPEHSGVS
jgi:3-aminobutyryl-CoA ammonia-lyase